MSIEIFVDGEDLAGKTSVSTLYAESSNQGYIVREGKLNFSNKYFTFAKYLSNKKAPYTAIEFAYSLAALKDLSTYKKTMTSEGLVIQVSSMLTRGLARQKVNNEKDWFNWSKMLHDFPEPRHAFFLYNDNQFELEQRLKKRLNESSELITEDDNVVSHNIDKYLRLQDSLLKINIDRFNTTIVNTKGKNLEEVVNEIREIVLSRS